VPGKRAAVKDTAAKYQPSEELNFNGRSFIMPFIQVKLIEGVFSASQKQEMIEKLTDAMVAIEGENMRQVTTVVIDETKSGDWGIGGKGITTEDVKALAAGSPVS
jgi:4-oxalocrotonate tautomerase